MLRNLKCRPLLSTMSGLLSIALIACSENSVDPGQLIGELEAASAAYDEAILDQDGAALERLMGRDCVPKMKTNPPNHKTITDISNYENLIDRNLSLVSKILNQNEQE